MVCDPKIGACGLIQSSETSLKVAAASPGNQIIVHALDRDDVQ
jgi:hypothetical protein